MTTTHPDLAALLAAVCQFPADDTPRLVLADWLDEHDGKVPCEVCVRKGCECPQHVPNRYAERAEFIRVQCELGRHDPKSTFGMPGWVAKLVSREITLLTTARRREWSGIKCPVCDGSGNQPGDLYDLGRCEVCSGDGVAPVEFRRGFVDRVTCRMGDVLREESCPHITGGICRCSRTGVASVLTDWARGVLAAHPVTRWEVELVPLVYIGDGQVAFESGDLPAPVFAELKNDPRAKGFGNVFGGETVATDALALAVGRVARRKWEEEAAT